VNDRETPDYTASDYVASILDSLRGYDAPKRNRGREPVRVIWEARRLVSHVAILEGGKVGVDEDVIRVSVVCLFLLLGR
jgi:hypothetical protein